MSYAIGLMSGTSFDGVDGVVYDSDTKQVIKHCFCPYSSNLIKQCTEISQANLVSLENLADLTFKVTQCYIKVINNLLSNRLNLPDISIIGVHGQTIRHSPNSSPAFSEQLIDASLISTQFSLPVACDFRSNDIALGGQGAPLAPAFHQHLFNLNRNTVVINLGGISNITYLDEDNNLRGYDTGPANCLLDAWIFKVKQLSFDDAGKWAAKGHVIKALLKDLLAHDYLKKGVPKSADKEYFSIQWLDSLIVNKNYKAEDVQATLMAFTIQSIVKEVFKVAKACTTLIVCGGGAANTYMMNLLSNHFSVLKKCDELGHSNAHIEAMLIAWLALMRDQKTPINLMTVTGASRKSILGAVYYP